MTSCSFSQDKRIVNKVFTIFPNASIILLTCGEQGSYLITKNIISMKAYPCEAIDTTGAGDAFAAAFLYQLLRGWHLTRTIVSLPKIFCKYTFVFANAMQLILLPQNTAPYTQWQQYKEFHTFLQKCHISNVLISGILTLEKTH